MTRKAKPPTGKTVQACATRRRLAHRLAGYDVAISELTVTEIQATGSQAVREQMLELVRPCAVLPVGEDARRLAQEYVRRGVFSAASAEDAVHVAVAVVARQDMLVSWNPRHLVHRRRRVLINETNILLGYPTVEVLAHPEV